MLLAVSCLQDPVAPSNEAAMPTVSYDKDTQTRVSVVLRGSIPANVQGLADYGFAVVEGGFSTGTPKKYSAKEQSTNAFSCLAMVTPNKHYEIRSYYTNGQQTKYSDAITFDAPSTSAAELSDVTYVRGKLTANIIDDGGREINEVGFCWAQEEDIRAIRRSSKHKAELNADGSFSLDFLGLRPGEVYYVLAYAENSDSDAEAVGYSRKPFILVVTEDDFVDIEDANFAAYLISNFDTNRDGKMSYREMKAITTIDVSTDNIASVREISLMPDLTRLSVAARNRGTGKLKKMDVNYNSKLTTIICDNNKLDSVVVRNIPMLDTLSCNRNQMTEIDVSSNPLLSYLDCGSNQIPELGDLSHNKELKHLDFRGNLVKEVDISPCLAIREFNATSCPSLKIIYVWPDFFDETEDHNKFYKDDTAEYVISPNAPIVIPDLNFRKYCIEHFDTDKNGEVSYKEAKDATRIDVCTDDIETLKGIAFFTSLTYLRCYGTVYDDSFVIRNGRLTSLDVSGQTELDTLDCSGNQLNSLNVSENTKLFLLNCAGNSLSTLDLSGISRLTDLDFKGNQVASIALSGNTALLRLDCSKNKLIALDVSRSVALKELNCSGNRIPVLDLSGNKEISWLDCSSNALQEMNIVQNRKLSYLDCTNNPLATIYLYANQVVTTLRKPEGTKLFYLIDSISILPETVSLKVEETCTLTAVIEPSDAIDKTVVWKSSDEKVAVVSDAGFVTAKTVGSCDITASCGGKTATRSVYVNPIPVEEITLDKSEYAIQMKQSFTLQATVKPVNATDKTVTWASSDESIATVSGGTVTGVSVGNCVITAKAGDKSASCKLVVNPIPVSEIILSNTSLELVVGDSQDLMATILPEDATDKSLTWESSDTRVATVSEKGKVTAIAVGSCTITAKSGTVSAECVVTVKSIPVSSISLDKSECSLVVGETQTLVATVLPDNATYKAVTWESSDAQIASVSAGVITAIGVGTCQITASAGNHTASCEVTVSPRFIEVASISLSAGSLALTVGESHSLTATVLPENATDKTVTWSSSDSNVATVSDGSVRAIAVGTCNITAKAGNQTATCHITVSTAVVAVTSVSLDRSSLSLIVGNSTILSATVLPENATDKTVAWSSDDTSVATISDGYVTAVGAGSCVITAAAGEKSDHCTVTVTAGGGGEVPVSSVSVTPASCSLEVGATQTLSATVLPDNATDKTVWWSSDNTSVATVSSSGVVTAVAVGTCKISAKAGTQTGYCEVTVNSAESFVAINSENFPDDNFRSYVSTNFDKDGDGQLSSDEINIQPTIYVPGMSIKSLKGIEFFTSLSSLVCYNNQLTTLDVSGNTQLRSLSCGGNQLKILGLSNNSLLTSLSCYGNQLTTLNLSGNNSLKELSCSNNQLTTLDLSGNPMLQELYCSNNQLTTLNVSNMHSLTFINCESNNLTELKVDGCANLLSIYCNKNQLGTIDIQSCMALQRLYCEHNSISSLDASGLLSLVTLDCYNSGLSSLLVDGCKSLQYLECPYNQLVNLDVSSCVELRSLNCIYNQLSSLSLGALLELVALSCSGNNLTAIDISGCSSLKDLQCGQNNLKSLDISSNHQLNRLLCEINQLTNLNVNNNKDLQRLECYNNQITSLDVQECIKIEYINCYNNKLSSLDVSKNESLQRLDCQDNQLVILDISNNIALQWLTCYGNLLTSLDVSNTSLNHLTCAPNPYLTEIWLKTGQTIENFVYDTSIATIKYK